MSLVHWDIGPIVVVYEQTSSRAPVHVSIMILSTVFYGTDFNAKTASKGSHTEEHT